MTGVLVKRGNLDTDRHVQRKYDMKVQRECHLQGMQKIASKPPEKGERAGTDLPSRLSEETNPAAALILDL